MFFPTPRLRNCDIGDRIKLINDSKERVIVHKCDRYAYFDLYKASLCCEVAREYMTFGEGGWTVAH